MKRKLTAILGLALIIMAGCKKEKTPAFDPVGYWRGNAFVLHTILYNKQDGKSNLYLKVQNQDTANTGLKLYGNYSLNAGKLKGTYLYPSGDSMTLETYTADNKTITGILVSGLTGEAIQFELHKE